MRYRTAVNVNRSIGLFLCLKILSVGDNIQYALGTDINNFRTSNLNQINVVFLFDEHSGEISAINNDKFELKEQSWEFGMLWFWAEK